LPSHTKVPPLVARTFVARMTAALPKLEHVLLIGEIGQRTRVPGTRDSALMDSASIIWRSNHPQLKIMRCFISREARQGRRRVRSVATMRWSRIFATGRCALDRTKNL
jgi:hypothetical protein